MWKPKNWSKNPCDDCPNKQEDIYGLLCDLACGKHTAYLNHEAGADAILEALKKQAIHIRHAGWVDVTSNLSEIAHDMGIYGKTGYLAFIPEEEVKECLKKL